jgi:hypothetical protein
MSLAAGLPEKGPRRKPRHSHTHLPNLATELVKELAQHFDLESFKAFRLTCKSLYDKSVNKFGLYHEALRLIITVHHLHALIEISKHPFSKHVRCLNSMSQPLNPQFHEGFFIRPAVAHEVQNHQVKAFLWMVQQ